MHHQQLLQLERVLRLTRDVRHSFFSHPMHAYAVLYVVSMHGWHLQACAMCSSCTVVWYAFMCICACVHVGVSLRSMSRPLPPSAIDADELDVDTETSHEPMETHSTREQEEIERVCREKIEVGTHTHMHMSCPDNRPCHTIVLSCGGGWMYLRVFCMSRCIVCVCTCVCVCVCYMCMCMCTCLCQEWLDSESCAPNSTFLARNLHTAYLHRGLQVRMPCCMLLVNMRCMSHVLLCTSH